MNDEKLSSDKVPLKFAEWLLSMGCPPEKVPSIDKLAEMCRGQYYMVWRSLMEHVEAKDSIRSKRMQVFCDDINRCQKKSAFSKPDSSVVVPEELLLWKQQAELREKVENAQDKLKTAKQNLNHLVEKVSSKLSHRNQHRHRVQDASRRAWLLQQVAEDLRTKKTNLLEAKSIAESLCSTEENCDVEDKLDKLIQRRTNYGSAFAAPLASSSVASNNAELNDSDEQLGVLLKCGGSLWPRLCERRAELTAALAAPTVNENKTNRITPQWVLSHTAGLHCTLALEAMKNKVHIKNMQNRLVTMISQLNELMTGEACELLVVRCERARAEARVSALRVLHDEITARTGVFAVEGTQLCEKNAIKHIGILDKAIESKRDELKGLMTSLAVTERKIQNVRECLTTVFNSFHNDAEYADYERFGEQLSLPQESMSTLRRFYEERRERHRNKMSLSLDLDTSENCSYDAAENPNPTFIDELKVYTKKFNLEKNRKLVLENGEKIWIFETVQSSVNRLHNRWQQDNVKCSLICPSVSLSCNLRRLVQLVNSKEDMEVTLKRLEKCQKNDLVIDITSEVEEEQRTIDKIKKRLNENLLSLQKTTKTLDLGRENLQLWADNSMKKYISNCRSVEGKTYKECESLYLENLGI